MTIVIDTASKQTTREYFKNQSSWLKIQSFTSNINGLKLFLHNANGNIKQIVITDTKNPIKENISEYKCFWFEYSSTDKNYDIKITIE
ncbi:hypothetical protein [Psychroserpens jangbogonensis]|uniref:hypothetical protein n=1 Tax=Psychroserpens jangbogonensis TaxID=1484460 RepID=UPI00053E26AE|nr:hypothetical protein [Psychroserpens jangbogonensis]